SGTRRDSSSGPPAGLSAPSLACRRTRTEVLGTLALPATPTLLGVHRGRRHARTRPLCRYETSSTPSSARTPPPLPGGAWRSSGPGPTARAVGSAHCRERSRTEGRRHRLPPRLLEDRAWGARGQGASPPRESLEIRPESLLKTSESCPTAAEVHTVRAVFGE